MAVQVRRVPLGPTPATPFDKAPSKFGIRPVSNDGTCFQDDGLGITLEISCDVEFTYSIWNWAIARRGPAYVSVYSYAVPVLAGVISFLLFRDSLSSGQIAGAGILFAGMLLARWGALARGEESATSAGERN